MKILILSFFLVLCSLLYSQGNLQFNQVINYDLIGSSSGSGDVSFQSLTVTIPVGKVWKVESASCRYQSTTSGSNFIEGGTTSNRLLILVDNVPVTHVARGEFAIQNELPLWLPAGAHSIVLSGYDTNTNSKNAFGKVSIIEFNIIP
jgi:hypothetical protein